MPLTNPADDFFARAKFQVFLYRRPGPSDSVSSLPLDPHGLAYSADPSRMNIQENTLVMGFSQARNRNPFLQAHIPSTSSSEGLQTHSPERPSPEHKEFTASGSIHPHSAASRECFSHQGDSSDDSSLSQVIPHTRHRHNSTQAFPFIVEPFLQAPPEVIDRSLDQSNYPSPRMEYRAFYIRWLREQFRNLNKNPLHPEWEGFVIKTEEGQQIWFEKDEFKNPNLSDNQDWWLATTAEQNAQGEQGEAEYVATEKVDFKGSEQRALKYLPNCLGLTAALLATGKPLVGVAGFFKIVGLHNPLGQWLLAITGSISSVGFYLNSNRRILKDWTTRILIKEKIQAIQRTFPAAHVDLLPALNRTPAAYICDTFLGFGYATGNTWMVVATNFCSSMPWLRYLVLGGIFATNLWVGIDKSKNLTIATVAMLAELFGKRNPALAVEYDLLTNALEHFSKALQRFDEVASELERSPFNNSSVIEPLQLRDRERNTLSKITIDWIRKYIEEHLNFLEAVSSLDKNCPMSLVLTDITDGIKQIEEESLLLEAAFENARRPQQIMTPTEAAGAQAPLMPQAYKTYDCRLKSFKFNPHFVGDNGKWRAFLEWSSLALSLGIAGLSAFSNISGNYDLWSIIPSEFSRLTMSVFCTLSVIGLNLEPIILHKNWLLKKMGHQNLRVSDRPKPAIEQNIFQAIWSATKESPLLAVSLLLAGLQGTCGAYYCINSKIGSMSFRRLCGAITFYTMTTTKLFATRDLLKNDVPATAKLIKNCVDKVLRYSPNAPIKTIQTNKISTEFYDKQIEILCEGITKLVVQLNNRLRPDHELNREKQPKDLWYWVLSNIMRINTVIDRELQHKLQLHQISIRNIHDGRASYAEELQRRVNSCIENLRVTTGGHQEFYAKVRPTIESLLREEFGRLSLILQVIDRPKAYELGNLQTTRRSLDGKLVPPHLFSEMPLPSANYLEEPPRPIQSISAPSLALPPHIIYAVRDERQRRAQSAGLTQSIQSSPLEFASPRMGSAHTAFQFSPQYSRSSHHSAPSMQEM